MKRFIEGENRFQSTLFPESLEDYIADDNPVRVIDAFVDGLDLKQLGFDRAEPNTIKWIESQIPDLEIDAETCVPLTRAGETIDWDLAVGHLFV